MWDKLANGQAEMFVAAWGASSDPDMYQVYHSSMADGKGSNHYQIKDKQLLACCFWYAVFGFIFDSKSSDPES